ncbi:hypothetical protein ABZX73_06365 [Brevibacterium casei]
MGKREPSPFRLGERVLMSGTVAKVRDGNRTEFMEARLPHKWSYTGHRIDLNEGIIIGSRTVQPGSTLYDSHEGNEFRPDIGEAKRVWLVTFDMHRKPVMCFDHQIETAEEAGDADAR